MMGGDSYVGQLELAGAEKTSGGSIMWDNHSLERVTLRSLSGTWAKSRAVFHAESEGQGRNGFFGRSASGSAMLICQLWTCVRNVWVANPGGPETMND